MECGMVHRWADEVGGLCVMLVTSDISSSAL